jgi:hypothetical protein
MNHRTDIAASVLYRLFFLGHDGRKIRGFNVTQIERD